jgi:Protein of unknown function (DUF3311)
MFAISDVHCPTLKYCFQLRLLALVGRNSRPPWALRSGHSSATSKGGGEMDQRDISRHDARSGWSWWYLLFVIQFVAVLWPPFYNSVEPSWAGIPFFYWYQLLWVIIGAILTAIVYFATEE